jgi:tetratricopeptide (TPR) repeat protein
LAHHTLLQIRPQDGKPYAEQALAIARAHQDKYNEARALQMLGLMLTDETDFVSIHSILAESQRLFRELHNEWEYALTVFASGWAAYRQQDWSNSLPQMEQALAIFRQFGDRYLTSVALSQVGMIQIKMGDLPQGKKALQEALDLAQQLDSKYEIASDVWRLGDAALQAENWTRSLHLYSAAKNVYDSIGAWQPEDDLKFEDKLVSCRAELDKSAFAAAIIEGQAMTMEQTIALALENENE